MFIEDIRPVSRRTPQPVRRTTTYIRRPVTSGALPGRSVPQDFSMLMPPVAAPQLGVPPSSSPPAVGRTVPFEESPAPAATTPPSTVGRPVRYRKPTNVTRRTLVTVGVCAGVTMLGAGAWTFRTPEEPSRHVSAATAVKPVVESAAEQPVVTPKPQLPYQADMDAAIALYPELQASATLVDLTSGESYGSSQASQLVTAASTAKLATVFCYIHLVEQGKAKLTQTIGGTSAQDSIMRMIVYSDNDAWDRLNRYLKFPQQQAYLDSLGLKATFKPNNLQFSTESMAQLLTMLYSGKVMNEANRAMVYDYMSRANMRTLILPALPAGATAYHKYGQIEGVLHDASIVTYNDRSYVWVVYTNNPANSSSLSVRQTKLIRELTAKVFADVAVAQANGL